jgi:hypothetical protein
MKNRFQNLPFKFNLQRYNAGTGPRRQPRHYEKINRRSARGAAVATLVVGLCTLNQVDP